MTDTRITELFYKDRHEMKLGMVMMCLDSISLYFIYSQKKWYLLRVAIVIEDLDLEFTLYWVFL